MILSAIKDFLQKNKKIMYYLGFFAVIYFALGDITFADPTESGDVVEDGENPITWFNSFIQIISTGVSLMGNIVAVFLSPGWTNATGLGFSDELKNLWIMISNIVYFIFAILIVVIAFMNIIGKGDKWELKQALPKFVVGVLIVPFSWFFVQLIVSLSALVSSSVLLIPYDSFVNSNDNKIQTILQQPVCSTYVIVNKKGEGIKNNKTTQGCGEEDLTIGGLIKGDTAYGLLGIYTYGIFSMGDIDTIEQKGIETFSDIFKLGINSLLILVMFLIYFILMISLALALFVRGIWLWLYMIFSPVFGLLYFFGKEKDGFMEGKFSITEFIGLAFVPVYVSGALAFGLLFTFVAGISFSDTTDSGLIKTSVAESTNYDENSIKKSEITGTGTRLTFLNNFNIDIYGDFGTSAEKGIEGLGVLKGGIGTFLMQLFGLAVLWIAVMAALNQSKITGAVIKPIADFGGQVGGLIAKSPQYAPIFGGQSMASISSAGSNVKSGIESAQATKGTQFAQKNFGSLMGDERSKKLQDIAVRSVGTADQAIKNIGDIFQNVNDSQELLNSKFARNGLSRSLERLKQKGLSDETYKEVTSATTATAFKKAIAKANDELQQGFKIFDEASVSEGQVDDKIRNNKSNSINTSEVKKRLISPVEQSNVNGVKQSRVLDMLIEVENGSFRDSSDYSELANRIAGEGLIGRVAEGEFKNMLSRLGVDNKNIDETLDQIKSYINNDGTFSSTKLDEKKSIKVDKLFSNKETEQENS